jgi:hypothetical protein
MFTVVPDDEGMMVKRIRHLFKYGWAFESKNKLTPSDEQSTNI